MFEFLISEIGAINSIEELQDYTLKSLDLYCKKRINFDEWCTASAHLRIKQIEMQLDRH